MPSEASATVWDSARRAGNSELQCGVTASGVALERV